MFNILGGMIPEIGNYGMWPSSHYSQGVAGRRCRRALNQ